MDEDIVNELRQSDAIFEGSILVREVTFRPAEIPDVKVTIQIWYDPDRRDAYRFDLSHYAHTPEQAGPYIPSGPWYPTEALALHRGISAITDWIGAAKAKGHSPHVTWLRPRDRDD